MKLKNHFWEAISKVITEKDNKFVAPKKFFLTKNHADNKKIV